MDIRALMAAFALLFNSQANGGPGLFQISDCDALRYHEFFGRLKQRIESQPFDPDFPYKMKMSFGLISGTNEVVANTATNFKSIYPDFKYAQLVGFANLTGDGVKWGHEAKPQNQNLNRDFALDDNQFFRRANAEYLQEQYREWGFPEVTWSTLQQQESMLSEHRRFEYAVSKQGKLLFFIRVYMGTNWKMVPDEAQVFAGDVPFTEVYATDGPFFYRRRVPTYFLPSDLIQRDPYSADNPLNSIRAEHERDGIVEIGRFFVERNAAREDVLAARKLGFAMLANHLADFAPQKDLKRLIVVATGGPSGSRLYESEFGLTSVSDLTPSLGGNAVGPLYDVIGRSYANGPIDATLIPKFKIDEPKPLRPNRSSDQEVKQISLLSTSGDQLMAKLIANGNVLPGFDLDQMMGLTGGSRTEYVHPIKLPDQTGWKFR